MDSSYADPSQYHNEMVDLSHSSDQLRIMKFQG
jgi:hypothetical protein